MPAAFRPVSKLLDELTTMVSRCMQAVNEAPFGNHSLNSVAVLPDSLQGVYDVAVNP
jgi:hypothetical protein